MYAPLLRARAPRLREKSLSENRTLPIKQIWLAFCKVKQNLKLVKMRLEIGSYVVDFRQS
jgi:hypothetical protein